MGERLIAGSRLVTVLLAVGFLLISFSVFYRLVVLPYQERSAQLADRVKNERERARCLGAAEEDFHAQWNVNCGGASRKEGHSCPIPSATADSLRRAREHYRDECYRAFPVR